MAEEKNQNYSDVEEFELPYKMEDHAGGFSALPEGRYLLEIVKVQRYQAPNTGAIAMAPTMKIVDSDLKDEEARNSVRGKLIQDRVFLKVEWRVTQFADAATGNATGQKLVAKAFLGKRVTADIYNEEWENDKGEKIPQNKISRYYAPSLFAGQGAEGAKELDESVPVDSDL